MSEITRLKGLFFTYFAFAGIYGPYFSLYLSERGYSIAQIGILLTVPNVLRVLAPPFWGGLADRTGRGDRLLRISTILSLLTVATLPLIADRGYIAISIFLAVLFFVNAAQVPIGEARALHATQADSGGYGSIRLWGSVGFILGVVLTGPALDRLSTASLPVWMSLAMLALLFVVWRAKPGAEPAPAAHGTARFRQRLLEPHIVAFFAANFLMIFAHAALYVLFSLFLEKHGYSKSIIGMMWAVGVVAEVFLFRFQRPLFVRFSAVSLLAFSLVVAAVRFTLVGLSGGAIAIIVVTQIMHGITFGLHHSSVMKLLHQWFPASQQARAQAAYITIAYGMGGAIGGLALTSLWSRIDAPTAFMAAGFSALLGAFVMLWCARLAGAHSSPR